MTDAMASSQGAAATVTLCANCQTRPGDRPTYFHEASVQYSSPYLITRGGSRAVSIRMTTHSGKVLLCARCASDYERSVTLREAGNRLMNISVLTLLLGGLPYVVASQLFPTIGEAPLSLVVAAAGLIVVLAFALALLAVIIGRLMRGPATRFLRT